MSTFLPQDSNDNPIPALRFKNGGSHSISAGGVSARNATAFADGTRIISVFATAPIYMKFGDAGVSATSADHYFPAGVYYDLSIGGDNTAHYEHIAVLAVDGAATVYVSEKE